MTTQTAHPLLERRAHPLWARHLTWLGVGLVVAFLLPFGLADTLDLPRDVYYATHLATSTALFSAWLVGTRRPVRPVLTHRWRLGLGVAAVATPLVVLAAVKAEDGAARPDTLDLAAAVLWRGVAYGASDGLLLAVFPILVVYAAFDGRTAHVLEKLAVGFAALVASLLMTSVYHLGYDDFRGARLAKPVARSPLWSAPTLLTASPLGAPVAHAALHVTAVVHSYDTELFLPPHEDGVTDPDR